MPLDKGQIEELNDMRVREFLVPEWNDTVYLRSMTGVEVEAISKLGSDTAKDRHAKICVIVLSDEDGHRLFTDGEAHKLSKEKSGSALMKIADAGLDFAGITEEGAAEIEGNSDATDDADSGLD
jgi:hypothetical protein